MRFQTTVSQFGNNTGIEVPPAVLDALGGGKRPAVAVTLNGVFEFRSTVGAMRGLFLIPFSAQRRADSGIGGGDVVTVDIELDADPREVEVPDDLGSALDAAGVRAAFDGLSPSARKAHVTSVTGAKAAETRARRVEKVVAGLTG